MKYRVVFMICILFTTAGTVSAAKQDSSLQLYKKTFKFLKDSNVDSALITIRLAYGAGLSDDSLFYAWSEIFTEKGALDTALALSLASKVTRDHPLYTSVMKQRYILYSATGQPDKASEFLDSLNIHPSYRMRRLIPELYCSIEGGIHGRETEDVAILPYRYEYERPEERLRTGAGGDLGFKWKFPIAYNQGFEPSIDLSTSQFHPRSPFSVRHALDSSSRSLSLKLRYYVHAGKLSTGYGWTHAVDYVGDASVTSRFDIRLFEPAKHGYLFGETGYEYKAVNKQHSWYGFLFVNRDLAARWENVFSFTVTGVHAKKYTSPFIDSLIILYLDGTKLYGDSLFSQEIPQFAHLISFFNYINDNIQKRLVKCYVEIPQSYLSSNLKVNQIINGRFGFSSDIGIGYGISWYYQDYIRQDLHYSTEDIPKVGGENNLLAYNRNDANTYWIRSITNGTVILDSIPVPVVNRKKRIDQIISANATFKKKIGTFLDIGINGNVSRTFSTLGKQAPVNIPVWSYGVMASTTIRFNPAGRVR